MKQFYNNIAMAIVTSTLYAGTVIGQTSVPGSRLIAESHYYASGVNLLANDSSSYLYPNGSTLLCNEKLNYLFNTTVWVPNQKSDYTYNTAGNLTFTQYQYWNTSSSSYINGGLSFYTLNSAGYCIKDSNVLWIPANSAYRDNVRNTYVVNSAGQITDNVYDSWDFGSNGLLHTFHYVNTYNAQGNPLVMLTQDWDASIHWMDHFQNTFVYDASGTHLQTITGEQDVNTPGVLQTTYQNVYTLNANGSVASCLTSNWNSSTSSYVPSINSTMTYDTSGNNILETQQQWSVTTSAYKPYQQYVRTFNAHHQITSQTRMMWNGTAYATPSSRDNYYYETSTTGISSTPGKDIKLSLFPTPTTGELHIALQWAEPEAFTATITDMTGRLCRTISAQAVKDYTSNISLGNLPAGNYVFTVRGEQGSIVSRIITLQH